jgi:hypothetical protein
MWLVILDRLADCMQNGDLRGRTIVLRGARSSRELVSAFLRERGVDDGRVVMIAAPEEVGALLEVSLAPSPTFAPEGSVP